MYDLDIKNAWDQSESHDHLLLGLPKTYVDIFPLHPEQVQIFKLWQIYLENFNPLLKVIYTPNFQAYIIDAAGDISSISPSSEALLSSIYCVAIHSLIEDECLTLFRSSRKDLSASYQSSCQQALLKCEFLRSGNHNCSAASYLYLVSVSSSHLTNLSLIFLDLCQTRYRCPISVFNAWSCHSDRAMHGNSQRVC